MTLLILLIACSATQPKGSGPPGETGPGETGPGESGPGETGAGETGGNEAGPAPSMSTPALVGRPTDSSFAVSAIFDAEVEAIVVSDAGSSAVVSGAAGEPLVLTVEGLAPDTSLLWHLEAASPGGEPVAVDDEHRLHTARAPGSTFVFDVQADPHLDDRSDLGVYDLTLDHEAADGADFVIDLGDTFMCEKHSEPFSADSSPAEDVETVNARYLYERENLGRLGVPLFLVNGNHEGEAGWLQDGGADNLAIWSTEARRTYFPVPQAGDFYSMSTTDEPFVGPRDSYYAWTWGDALFIVLDPFWYTSHKPHDDLWEATLGDEQLTWLAETLAASDATFRFVFIHNLVGGIDDQGRGGVEAAPYYEWGGLNADGTDGFAEHRPGLEGPIHDLLVNYHVNAVFHGHDHLYAHQELDGIVYQEVPQPSVTNYNSGEGLAEEGGYLTGDIDSSSGHLRITVSPDQAQVEYVRSYLAEDESGSRHDGDISQSYILLPR